MMWLKIVTSFLSAVHSYFPEPAAPPALVPAAAAQVEKAAGAAETMTADELLTRLEKSDEKLATIQAEMMYDKTMVIAGDRQIRSGELFFKSRTNAATAEKTRTFAIHFNTLQLGTRIDSRRQQYIFDGEWLIERMPDEKQIIKRQVVKPGEKFDPLKIGEGPLPIPIGQKKADILSRYDATLVDAADGLDDDAIKEFAKGSWQLKLIPKEGADRNFKEIRLWYREEAAMEGKPVLPRMARTVDSADDVSLVQLINMTINQKIDESRFDVTPPDATWSVDVRPFRQ